MKIVARTASGALLVFLIGAGVWIAFDGEPYTHAVAQSLHLGLIGPYLRWMLAGLAAAIGALLAFGFRRIGGILAVIVLSALLALQAFLIASPMAATPSEQPHVLIVLALIFAALVTAILSTLGGASALTYGDKVESETNPETWRSGLNGP